ncbi:type II toxin-antitoxin system RelE/ParE family toxin [Streptomyces sodiiphilus]|uniref:Type II toxin-antitoxin system RelE/ParE family toxin n=1 Tax=Streptomyces sodiiphilus TaxID=226217 RepID=A0ABN2NV58_9ACTN
MWKIILLEPVDKWFLGLCEADEKTANLISDALDHLAAEGPSLGRPIVDRVHGSQLHNLKELRPSSRGTSEVRMLFVFDPDRAAIVLVAGDKAGRWSQWYAENVPVAERRYRAYRQAVEEGEGR